MTGSFGRSGDRPVDVLVVGGGNAGLCAAIAARQEGARVVLIEKAARGQRGGNSSLTMNFRFPHERADQLLELLDDADQTREATERLRGSYAPYSWEAMASDLLRTSDEQADRDLVFALCRGAWETIGWLRGLGHRWEHKPNPLPGSVPVRLKNSGRRLQEHSFEVAERLGVEIRYGCCLEELVLEGRRVVGARVRTGNEPETLDADAVVLACGGYQANPELRARHLGPAWKNVALRGVPFNTGDGHTAAARAGAVAHGDYTHCHATPQDSGLAPYMLPGQNAASQDNSRYAFNYGVSVNRDGERFIDEGQDLPNFVYAKFGAAIVRQPEQIAFQIFDARSASLLPKSYFRARNVFRAPTLEGLAAGLGIDVAGFTRTLEAFNAGASDARSDLRVLDNVSTVGVAPPKSNWATKIDHAPFYACPVRAGITFAYGGIRIDRDGHVLARSGERIPGLFAAGEIVGGVFFRNYAGGTGLMSGAYFGRRAGTRAASASDPVAAASPPTSALAPASDQLG